MHLKPVLALKNTGSAFIYRICSPIHFISVSDVIKSMVEVTQSKHVWPFVCLFKKMHIYQRDSLLKCDGGEINQCWFLKVRSVIWVFKACAVFIIIKSSSLQDNLFSALNAYFNVGSDFMAPVAYKKSSLEDEFLPS